MSNIKLVHSGGNSVSLTVPDSNPAANRTFKLPRADGSDGQFLKTDGSGALSFATPSSNTGARQVLEQFASLADGSTHVLSQGSITMQDVTATQDMTTTWTDLEGSVVNYKPPTGTVQVIFDFSFFCRNVDTSSIMFFAMSVDDTANVNSLLQLNTASDHHYVAFRSVIHIGATYTGGASVGQYTSWGSSTKYLSVKGSDYSNSHDGSVNDSPHTPHANWYTQGFSSGTTGSGTNAKIKPVVQITAIGSV